MNLKQALTPALLAVVFSVGVAVTREDGIHVPGPPSTGKRLATVSDDSSLTSSRDGQIIRDGRQRRAPVGAPNPTIFSSGYRGASATAPANLGAPQPAAACTKLIDVNLTTQELVASGCGTVYVSTPITSGRSTLPTPTGTFTVFLKEQNVYFYSPWPVSDPNYYPPMFVAYAMEFLNGGYFLHTDPDEPGGAFGPGSENGPYASHGCVHVPSPAMVQLYGWADTQTTVRIHY